MVSGQGSPSVVRRQLGRRLRDLRLQAGKTIEDVRVAGIASPTKIWRIEGGTSTVRAGDVLALTRLYRADNKAVDELLHLADATNESGYLEDLSRAVTESSLYADLEADSAVVADFTSELVPGLLQTRDYIRGVMEDSGMLTPEVVDQRIEFRLRRQRAFFDRPRPKRLDVVLTEGALRVEVGSSAVMQAQREHLLALTSRDGVRIRILPFARGLHPAMIGPFTILDFDDPDDPSFVYLRNMIGNRYIERAEHVARFRQEFGLMWPRAVPIEDFGDD
jgi:hypothetical protein